MANEILTRQEITFDALMTLENQISFTKNVTREYDSEFGVTGRKIGYTLNIRKPSRVVSTAGQGIQLQDYIERMVPLTLNKQYQQAFAFTSSDMSLSLDDFTRRVTKPRIIQIANDIDYDGLQQFVNVPAEAGTPGTIPTAASTYLTARQILLDEAFTTDELSVHIPPKMMVNIFPALAGLVSASGSTQYAFLRGLTGKQGTEEYVKGRVTQGLGFERGWFETQNSPTFTVGTQGGTPTVAGGGQTGSSIATQAWTGSTQVLNQGDIISFAGVHRINPLTRQSTGDLRTFVVLAPVTSAGGGTASIPIACVDGDGITIAGPYQTVDASPANTAPVTVNGASATQSYRGIAFHPQAFTFACATLEMYDNQHISEEASDKELALSIRFWAQPDINTDRLLARLDVLGGWATMYPQGAVRITA